MRHLHRRKIQEALRGRRRSRRLERATVVAALLSLTLGTLALTAGPAAATASAGSLRLGASGRSQVVSGHLTRSAHTGAVIGSSRSAEAARPSSTGQGTPRAVPYAPARTAGGRMQASPAAPPTVSCSPPSSACASISSSSGGATTNRHGLAATANGGIYGLDVEPPDQGLCAGSGYVMELINLGELQVFRASTLRPVSGITSLDSLLGLTALNWSSGGDTMCTYDPQNGGHWFITEIVSTNSEASGGTFTGCFAGKRDKCREGLAVSTNDDPLSTSWNIYFVDPNVINPRDPGAGYLLNDFAKTATTRDAFLMFYDEFIINPKKIPRCPAWGCLSFNGAQELAIQKSALELGYSSANLVHENMGRDPFIQPPDGPCYRGRTAGVTCWASVIPTTVEGGQFDDSYDGTGFMTASLDFNSFATGVGPGDNRVAVFYWTGLAHLNSFNCGSCAEISFGGQLLTGVERYTDNELAVTNGQPCYVSSGDPVCSLARQRLGTRDLGTYCASKVLGIPPFAGHQPCPEGGLASNGDNVTQASYADGQIWFDVSTVTKETFGSNSEIHLGAAYWIVGTSRFTGAQQLLTLTSQGYVAAAHEDLVFPTLVGATTASNGGLMSFTLSGNGGPTRADGGGFFPSSAYGFVTPGSNGVVSGTINVADLGRAPQDGFTEYDFLATKMSLLYRPRWGDYGGAVFVPGLGFVFASEYIQHANCDPAYWYKVDPTCGGTRDPFANFGTSINSVR